jgi:hypothetical protein
MIAPQDVLVLALMILLGPSFSTHHSDSAASLASIGSGSDVVAKNVDSTAR